MVLQHLETRQHLHQALSPSLHSCASDIRCQKNHLDLRSLAWEHVHQGPAVPRVMQQLLRLGTTMCSNTGDIIWYVTRLTTNSTPTKGPREAAGITHSWPQFIISCRLNPQC